MDMNSCLANSAFVGDRRSLRLTVMTLLALFAVATAAACSSRIPSLEARAVALDRQIMCPICDGQTLDESRSGLAGQMREVIREKLAAGESEEQIRAYFSDPGRYGVFVLASPPASGFNLALWVLPPVAAAAAAGTLYLIMWGKRRRAAAEAAPVEAERDLSQYLERVDSDLGLKGLVEPGASGVSARREERG